MNTSIIRKIAGNLIFYSGLYHLIPKNNITILMYHRVTSKESPLDSNVITSSKENFEKQMKYLSENCNVITFNDLKEKPKKNSIIITFDDGYKDNYTTAYPILKKYNLPATIFLATGHINKNELFWWDKIAYIINKTKIKKFSSKEQTIINIQEKLKKVSESKKKSSIKKLEKTLKVKIPKIENIALSWENIKEMSKNNISFGAHTVSHPIITRISLKEAKSEILKSKNKIEKMINKKVSVFAYPNGGKEDMSDQIDKFLKENGFDFSVSTIYGTTEKDSFRLNRIGVQYEDDLKFFRIKLSGIGKVLEKVYSKFLR